MSETTTPTPFPDATDLCITRPLYAPFEVPDSVAYKNQLYEFITENYQLDTFCPYCAQSTVLLGGKYTLDMQIFNFTLKDITFEKAFFCSRQHWHKFFFYFRLENRILMKIGQSPSMADIEQGHIQHYRAVLDREHYQELNRSLGLASHGVGIGSFVYLRRIFERLVDEAKDEALKASSITVDDYQKARMDEKILLLKDYLPQFLVEQRTMYGILSLGVHSLDEETCLTHFPVIRAGIELILDQKLAIEQQAKKMAEAKRKISQIQQQIQKA